VPLTTTEFVERVSATGDFAAAIVKAHIEYYDEVLLHVLVADLRRLAVEVHARGDAGVLGPLLAAMSLGLVEGDAAVHDAIAVSFVEDTGWWDSKMAAFIATWPGPLRREIERQRFASGGR
jgi:hypothetical protein